MRCIDCCHGALRDRTNAQRDETLRNMAKRGLVNCLKSDCRASFMPHEREITCALFEPTDKETAEKRAMFFKGKP
jgi:hypothetical protein